MATIPRVQRAATAPLEAVGRNEPRPGPPRAGASAARQLLGLPARSSTQHPGIEMGLLDPPGRRSADLEQGARGSVLDVLGLPRPTDTQRTSARRRTGAAAVASVVAKSAAVVATSTGPVGALLGFLEASSRAAAGADRDWQAPRALMIIGAAAASLAIPTGVAAFRFGLSELEASRLQDADADGLIVDVLSHTIAHAPSNQPEAVRAYLASNWPLLRSHFHDLVGPNVAVRELAATALASNPGLNAAVGTDAARLPLVAVAMGLIDDMKDILNDAPEESPLTDRQYMDISAELASLANATPLQAFWRLQTLREADGLPDDASPELRLAAALLTDAGCNVGSMRPALATAEAQAAAPVHTGSRPASPSPNGSADPGEPLPPHAPVTAS